MDVAGDRNASDLLEALFSGLLAPNPWEDFLRKLTAWLGASFATLIIAAPGMERPGTLIAPGADPQTSEDYVSSFFASDPFTGLPEGKVTSLSEFMAGLDSAESRQYRQFLEHAGGEQVLGVDLKFEGRFEARLRISRDETLSNFSRADRNRLASLVSHLRTALRLFERLQFAGAEHGVFSTTIDALGIATLVLDRTGEIVSANDMAERLIDVGATMKRVGNALVFADATVRHGIASLLRDPGAGPARYVIERETGGDVRVLARPIALPAIHPGHGAVALFVSAPELTPSMETETMRHRFRFTPSEANLAQLLVGGSSLVEAAAKLGIAHNTARVHLRAIFAKTGAKRQAHLVHLLRPGLG